MHTRERLHEKFVDTAVAGSRIWHAIIPSASTTDLSRQEFARALRDLPMTKDALLNPWTETLIAVWGIGGYDAHDSNQHSIIKAVAPNILRSVLTRNWDEPTDPKPDVPYDALKDKATRKTPELLRLSFEQENVVRFLGFEDEKTFMDKMPGILSGKINKLMCGVSEDEIQETLKPVFDFAEAGYGTRSPRKGGESFYCHALRVLYYTLDHLFETGTQITSPQDMVDIVTVALLHDAKEDFVGLTVSPLAHPPATPEQRNRYYQSKNPRERSLYTYRIDLPNGKGARTVLVSSLADQCIDAVTSPEVETDADKFRKVIMKSPWSIVEIIKSFDRLDNVLTYIFPTDSWWKYLYKMYESTLGMSRLSTAAEVTHPLEKGPKIDHHSPGEFVAYGMMMNALYGIRQEFLDRTSKYTDTELNLRKKVVRGAKDRSTLTLDDRQYAGIDVVCRRVINRMKSKPEEQEILCIKDLREYEEDVKEMLNNWKSFGDPVLGYGRRPYVRRRTRMDERIRYVKAFSDASMIVGTGALSAGMASGIVLHDLSEGKMHEAMIKAIVLGTGLSLGGLTGKEISKMIYRRRPHRRLI